MNGARNKNVIMAPRGSDNPDNNVYRKAFSLLLVE